MESQKIVPHRLLLVLLGFTAMATQVILIREVLAIFQGNELVIGMFLGIWMILTATGAYLSVQSSKFKVQSGFLKNKSTIDNRQSTIENPIAKSPNLLFLLALLPVASLFLLVTLRFSLVPAGIMPGLGKTILVFFLALLPFCMVSGLLFPKLVNSLSLLKGKNLLHEGYALESAGGVVGGLLFSLVFILILPPYESLVLLSTFCLLVLFVIWLISGKIVLAILALVTGAVVFLMPTVAGIARYLDRKQFSRQDVVEIRSSPFGLLAVSKMGNELIIYDNGSPVSLSADVIQREEAVHYAMLLHRSPKKVLLVSGGVSGAIDEILKYPVEKVDYVEPNPWLIRLVDKYRPLPDDRRIRYIYKDPLIFLRNNPGTYDVILINAAEPHSAESNRYSTAEFYKLLKDKLNHGGIVSVATEASGNYMNETSQMIHSVNYNTFKSAFSYIRIIPGAKDYFLVSDTTIEQSIFKHYQDKGIDNEYVNPFYIDEELLRMRSELIHKDLLPDAPVNSDLKPFVFSLFLRHWLEKFKMNTWIIPLILVLLLILSLIFFGPLNLGLFAGGFTASGLEFILLIWFQVIYGNVYQMTGVIFAVFMLGLVIGSLLLVGGIKKNTFKGYLMIQGGYVCLSLLVALLMIIMASGSPGMLTIGLILFLVLLTGLLMGTQFSSSAHLRTTSIINSARESFSADLAGSATGIVLVSVYVVPLLGLPVTALFLAGLNVLATGVMAWKREGSWQ
ncbi:MAG TPA: hypothetical protein PKM34_02070 [Bacteroidales bacterium]|nr:hypothetical protein [Bacteroidales bacterium]